MKSYYLTDSNLFYMFEPFIEPLRDGIFADSFLVDLLVFVMRAVEWFINLITVVGA